MGTFQTKHDEFNARCDDLEQEIEANSAIHKGHEQEHNKIKGDPDRIRKQAEKFESAVNALLDAQRDKKKDIEETNELVKQNEKKQKDAEEQRAKKQMRLQLMTESSKITDQSCEDVKKRLEREKNQHLDLQARRVGLDSELDELHNE